MYNKHYIHNTSYTLAQICYKLKLQPSKDQRSMLLRPKGSALNRFKGSLAEGPFVLETYVVIQHDVGHRKQDESLGKIGTGTTPSAEAESAVAVFPERRRILAEPFGFEVVDVIAVEVWISAVYGYDTD